MIINVLTLFPEMFESFLTCSIIKRAIDDGKVSINLIDFREYSDNKHKKVDGTPYGGGAGMVLSVEPIHKCLQSIDDTGVVIALTPTGKVLNDTIVNELKDNEVVTILCGHYEGFDERVYKYCDSEISIGDYILTGGETAAFVLIDAISRKVDGVINSESVKHESFSQGILDYPVYTKPQHYNGESVPNVLLSGNHKEIDEYRYKMALQKTYLNRKDLFDKNLENVECKFLQEIIIDEKEEWRYD